MKKEVKPDWITDRQWAAIPHVKHWEMQRRIGELQKLQRPLTPGEAVEQQRQAYLNAGIKVDF